MTRLRFTKINPHQKKRLLQYTTALTLTSLTTLSLYTRRWRKEHLSTLPDASTCGAFVSTSPSSSSPEHDAVVVSTQRIKNKNNNNNNNNQKPLKRDISTVISNVTRAGLMGTSSSVKDELESIRKWHRDHNFRGGLVLRELDDPLFMHETDNDDDDDDDDDTTSSSRSSHPPSSSSHRHQRECYYLYYELLPNGRMHQQLFCRGTTLLPLDLLTSFQSVYLPDPELKNISLHRGYCQHADRLVQDVEPLLVHGDRSTVEVAGHSLGGAVAMIVAMKLKMRGYNVTRVTSVGAPRICCCDGKDGEVLRKLLPRDTLRVEDEGDVVVLLPPYGVSLGDKLWFVGEGMEKFVRWEDEEEEGWWWGRRWWDSVFVNFELGKVLMGMPQAHYVPSYLKKLKELKRSMKEHQCIEYDNRETDNCTNDHIS